MCRHHRPNRLAQPQSHQRSDMNPSQPARPALCVFTSSSEHIDQRYLELAGQLGEAMCARGIDLVSGGGRISTMGSIARAVRAGGGRTVGVIPRSLVGWEIADTDADELLVTETMRERKALMDAHSDGFLALPGGLGTLEELFEAWTGRTLGMHRKPVVILDPWDDFADIRRLLDGLIGKRMVRLDSASDVSWTSDIDSALDLVEAAWSAGEGRGAPRLPSPPAPPAEWLEAD